MIAQIETAIVQRLQSASKHGLLGYTLKTVESYGGQLDDEETLNRLAVQLPACFIVFLHERSFGEYTNAAYKFDATFGVIVVTKNARGEAATRHGATTAKGQEVGSYQILRDVRRLLVDNRLGLGGQPLVPQGVKSLFNGLVRGKSLSVLSSEFSMEYVQKFVEEFPDFPLEGGLPTAPLPPLEEIAATWLCPCGFETGTSIITPGKDAGEGETHE